MPLSHPIVLAGAAAVAAGFAFGGPDLSPALLPTGAVPTSLAGWSCEPVAPQGGGATERCRGHGGAAVILGQGPGGTTLGLAWPSTAATGPLVAAVDRAAAVEWRGRPSSRGFAPHAAIVRVAGGDGEAAAAVLRVAPGEACLVARLAGPDAEAAARRIADGRARSFRCGRDGPEDEGPGLQRRPSLG